MIARDLKYILAYTMPLSVFISLYIGGIFSFTALIFAFGLLPLLELIAPAYTYNYTEEEEKKRLSVKVFDFLLYLNLPIVFGLLIMYLYKIENGALSLMEAIGMTTAMGIASGTIGINVGHEIGHRFGSMNQWISRFLYLPSLYLHFNIEHNRGHHKHVATPLDPATALFGESIYAFFPRSVYGGFKSAWNIQKNDLKSNNQSFWSIHNLMLIFMVIQVAFLVLVTFLTSVPTLLWFIISAILGFGLLEAVNYIEHYGLMRNKKSNGRYEPVQLHHSWNSDYELGRIILYELTRHSDHHFKSTRKYQVLRSFEKSPHLPYGYPGSILVAMVPPVWFSIMNPLVNEQRSKTGQMALSH